MTPQQLGPEVSRHPRPPDYTPRLRLKPKAPPTGHVDGAWWPWSENLTKELPDLLAVLSVRLGPIHRVRYHSGEWAKAPAELAVDGRTVRLDGDRGQPINTLDVIGDQNRIVLLLVSPDTEADVAHTAMMAAAGRDNDFTVDELLGLRGE